MDSIPKDPLNLFAVKGRTALITGATGAFGEMAATILSRAGCNIVVAAGGTEKLSTIADRLRGEGGRVETCALRPNSEENCDELVEATVARFGRLDIVVVASGMSDVDLIEDLTLDRWQAVMDANVRDPWMLCRATSSTFKQQAHGGKVILVSSARSILGHPEGYSAYCTSKSAVDGLVRSLGCEWGQDRITVNAIGPTVFRSPLTEWMFADNEKGRTAREGILARIPIGRLGEPIDLAGPLLFLASDASDFMTGQVLRADGGYTAG